MSDDREVLTIYDAIARLCLALKQHPIKGKVWTHKVDEHWTVAVNGTSEKRDAEINGTMGAPLGPLEAAVWWNGWLAAIFGPFDGGFAAGSLANEATCLAAIEAAIEEAA